MRENGWVSFEFRKLKMGGKWSSPKNRVDTEGKKWMLFISESVRHVGDWDMGRVRGNIPKELPVEMQWAKRMKEEHGGASAHGFMPAQKRMPWEVKLSSVNSSSDIFSLGYIFGERDGVLSLWLNLLWDLAVILPIFSAQHFEKIPETWLITDVTKWFLHGTKLTLRWPLWPHDVL